jgi:hypothetical protein
MKGEKYIGKRPKVISRERPTTIEPVEQHMFFDSPSRQIFCPAIFAFNLYFQFRENKRGENNVKQEKPGHAATTGEINVDATR